MYIETKKGKRIYYDTVHKAYSSCNNNSSISMHWSTTDTIWNIFKSRLNIVEHAHKSKAEMFYWISNVVTKLIITKNDLLEVIKNNDYNYFKFNNVLIVKENKFISNYNKENNTDIKYVSYGKEYNKYKSDLTFSAISDKDFSKINELLDDWTTSIEVYQKENFNLITEYTDAEKKSLAIYKVEDNNQAIFDTFLKQSLETIMNEFGLYYNDYSKAFRFKSVKDFRNFLVTAINEIIVKKLHENNINCLQIRDLINVRCMKIEPTEINIIKACDLTALNEETNNE